jgi:hypothetical protein
MDDDRSREIGSFLIAAIVAVMEIEPFGELEIELKRGALVVAAERVSDEDVDLGAVECTVLGVDRPRPAEPVQRIRQMLFDRLRTFRRRRERKIWISTRNYKYD